MTLIREKNDWEEKVKQLEVQLGINLKKLEHTHQGNKELNRENEKLKKEVLQMEEKLKGTDEAIEELTGDIHRQCRTHWDSQARDLAESLKLFRNLAQECNQKIIQLGNRIKELDSYLGEAHTQNGKHKIEALAYNEELSELQAESERRQKLAEEMVAMREQQIVMLTEMISRSSQQDDTETIPKDDDYFATEFSYLANSIQQWVFRHFRSVLNQRQSLNYLPQASFEATVLKPPEDSRDMLDAISAIVAHRLVACVFPLFPPLQTANPHNPFWTLFSHIGDAGRQSGSFWVLYIIYN